MFEVMHSCHFSAKRHRLDCLYFIIVHVSKDESEQMKREIVASFLTEIVLGLKEVEFLELFEVLYFVAYFFYVWLIL